jgi:hypothetical protein
MAYFSNRDSVTWAQAMLASLRRPPFWKRTVSATQAKVTIIGRRHRRIGRFDVLRMCVQSPIASVHESHRLIEHHAGRFLQPRSRCR